MPTEVMLPSGTGWVGPGTMGEAAEILCERYTSGLRVKRSHRAEDVVGKDRRHYQVKSRTRRTAGRQIEIPDGHGFGFDVLFLVVFESDRLTVHKGGVIDRKNFQNWEKRRWSATNNKWEYSLTREFWSLPGMKIITEELQVYDMLEIYTQVFSEWREESDE